MWRLSISKPLRAAAASLFCFIAAPHSFGHDNCNGNDSISIARYEQRLQKRLDRWKRLIPNMFTLQYAGGAGMFSAGVGWDYGSGDQWETHLTLGFLPKEYNRSVYWTLTLKENYLPWRVNLGRSPLELRPLCVTLGLNSILHSDFWTSEPDRYPGGYYGFSSRVRIFLGLGQRLTLNIPYNRRRLGKQLSLYYEISTCDLYVRQKFLNSSIPLKDIITIGVGAVYTI